MLSETTYTRLRENLASVLDDVVDQQDVVIVRRSGARDVALIPASELARLLETARLLRSSQNARRLLSALRRSKAGSVKSRTTTVLRKEMLGEATGQPAKGAREPSRQARARPACSTLRASR